jgi:hypothetical protein
MLDSQILAATIASRSSYESIKDHFNAKEASPSIAFWYELVRDYYGRDSTATAVQSDTLRELGARRITNPKHADAILSTLDDLKPVSSPNVVELVLDLRRSNLALEFASATSNKEHDKASELLTQLNAVWEQTDLKDKSDVEYAKDWDTLDSAVGNTNRTGIGPASLDSRIGGGLLPGHHMLVFGRTEIGKSCLTCSMTANLIRSGKSVLYIGNEDSINILKSRVRLSLLGQPQSWLNSHPNKTKRLLAELCGDRLTMVHVHPGSISEVEDLVAKHSPNITILDQIRNLSGAEDGMTQKMEHNAIRFRSLLGRQKMIGISVAQAGDRSQGHNSDGPIYLSAGDVDSSRVGLPGTVDLQIGVGANAEMQARGLRMLSFAKNKLATGGKSREPLLVRFNLELNRVEDTI